METETSAATNQTGPAPVQMVEIPNPIVVEPSVQALAIPNQVMESSIRAVRDQNPIAEPTAQAEPQNEMADELDDDIMIVTPATVDIKREQQVLALELAKNCNPNVMIDLMDDENMIVMKTEINDENVAPNRANAMENPIRNKVMAKKPQKPIVERCVGRICAIKKRSRLNDGTIDGAAAASEVNESENETISDGEDSEIVSQATDNQPGIIDATDVNLVVIAFQDPVADSDVPDPFVASNPTLSYCEPCNTMYANAKALQSYYRTKKHKSNVLELAFNAARKLNITSKASQKSDLFSFTSGGYSPVIDIQDPVPATNRPQSAAHGDESLHCQVCEFTYSSIKSMAKHLKTKKHAENLVKAAPQRRPMNLDSIEID